MGKPVARYKWFGLRVRECREAAGFTQADLAIELGVLRTQIDNIEAGRSTMPAFKLPALAWALEVDYEALLGEPRRRGRRA